MWTTSFWDGHLYFPTALFHAPAPSPWMQCKPKTLDYVFTDARPAPLSKSVLPWAVATTRRGNACTVSFAAGAVAPFRQVSDHHGVAVTLRV